MSEGEVSTVDLPKFAEPVLANDNSIHGINSMNFPELLSFSEELLSYFINLSQIISH